MQVIDTLQILIEADRRGLETQLRTAGRTISSFVDKMNNESVGWDKILAGTISPAIITGVATMFAAAIAQSLAFQDTTTKTAETLGFSGSQLKIFGKDVLNIASQTGQSSSDIQSAYSSLYPVFGNMTEAQKAVLYASMASASGFGDLKELASSLAPLFKEWGVTTADSASKVITALENAAQEAGLPIADIISKFGDLSAGALKAGMGLKDLPSLLVNVGAELAKLSPAQAAAVFQTMAEALSKANPALNAVVGSSASLREEIQNKGLAVAIEDVGTKIQNRFGKNPMGVVISQFGLTTEKVNGFNSALKNYPDITALIQKTEKNMKDLTQNFNESDTALRELSKDYQILLQQFTSPGLANFFKMIGEGMQDVLPMIDKMFKLLGTDLINSPIAKLFGAIAGVIRPQVNPNDTSLLTPYAKERLANGGGTGSQQNGNSSGGATVNINIQSSGGVDAKTIDDVANRIKNALHNQ